MSFKRVVAKTIKKTKDQMVMMNITGALASPKMTNLKCEKRSLEM